MKSGCAFMQKLRFACCVFSRYIALECTVAVIDLTSTNTCDYSYQQEGHYQLGNIAAAITSHCQRIIVHGKGVKEHVMMEDKRVSAKRWKLKNKSRKTFQVTIAIRLNVIRGRDYPMQSEKHWS